MQKMQSAATEMEKAALSKALKQDELPDLADLVLKRTPGRRTGDDDGRRRLSTDGFGMEQLLEVCR